MLYTQYAILKQIFAAALSDTAGGPRPLSEPALLGFMKRLAVDAAATTGSLSAQSSQAFNRALRAGLTDSAASPNIPSDADVSAFISQVIADSAAAASLSGSQYSALLAMLRCLLSDSGIAAVSPTEADLLRYVQAGVIVFPASVLPSDIVFWFNGDAQAYSDLSGTVPCGIPDPVGAVRELSPLTGVWAAPSTTQRPRRGPHGSRFDIFGASLPGQALVRDTAPAVNLNNTTILCSFVCRDGTGGPQLGLVRAQTPSIGMFAAGGVLGSYVNGGGIAFNTLSLPRAQRITAIVSITSTGIQGWTLINGAVVTETQVATVTGGQTNGADLRLASGSGSEQGFYGSISQAMVLNRSVSDAEARALMAWADAKVMDPGYPTSSPLWGVAGDSIGRGSGVVVNSVWPQLALANLRPTYPGLEICNGSIVGSGSGITAYTDQIAQCYSTSRAKNILTIATGTNDQANGNPTSFTLTNLYAMADRARADGWKVIMTTILPRSDVMIASQSAFNTSRATINTDIRANWSKHAHALADIALVSGMGADGDSDGANYVDKVHPSAAGYLLIEPVHRAAALSLLAF